MSTAGIGSPSPGNQSGSGSSSTPWMVGTGLIVAAAAVGGVALLSRSGSGSTKTSSANGDSIAFSGKSGATVPLPQRPKPVTPSSKSVTVTHKSSTVPTPGSKRAPQSGRPALSVKKNSVSRIGTGVKPSFSTGSNASIQSPATSTIQSAIGETFIARSPRVLSPSPQSVASTQSGETFVARSPKVLSPSLQSIASTQPAVVKKAIDKHEEFKPLLSKLANSSAQDLGKMLDGLKLLGTGACAKAFEHDDYKGVIFRARNSTLWRFKNEKDGRPDLKYIPVVYLGELAELKHEQNLGLPLGVLVEKDSSLTEIPASQVLTFERQEQNFAMAPIYAVKYTVMNKCHGRALDDEYIAARRLIYNSNENKYYDSFFGKYPTDTLDAFYGRYLLDKATAKDGDMMDPKREKIAKAYEDAMGGIKLSVKKNAEIDQSAYDKVVAMLNRNKDLNFDFSNCANAKVHDVTGEIQLFDFCAGDSCDVPYSKGDNFNAFFKMMICENQSFGINMLSHSERKAINNDISTIFAKIVTAIANNGIKGQRFVMLNLAKDYDVKGHPIDLIPIK